MPFDAASQAYGKVIIGEFETTVAGDERGVGTMR